MKHPYWNKVAFKVNSYLYFLTKVYNEILSYSKVNSTYEYDNFSKIFKIFKNATNITMLGSCLLCFVQ